MSVVPHGLVLSPADRILLRGRPPAPALAWAAEAVGAGARVVPGSVRALEGGTSSAVHALDVRDRAGAVHALVLRRFVRQDWLAEAPDAPAREAAALRVVEACAVPTPRLVAVDPEGRGAGDPAVLMTRLPGATDFRPADLDVYLRALADVLPAIHATPVPAGAIPAYETYHPRPTRPPAWTADADAWHRALALLHGPAPAGTPVLVHRDFHPGNVLWRDGRVAGVVDWAVASVGPADADVGYCRVDLTHHFGVAAADRFLAHTGRRGLDPYWDVAAALGGHTDQDLDGMPHLDAFVQAAMR